MWFASGTFFSTALMKDILYGEIKSRRPQLQILTCFIFLVLFSNRSRFYSRRQPFIKSCYSWERIIDDIAINYIGNIEDSPGFVFINEEVRNVRMLEIS